MWNDLLENKNEDLADLYEQSSPAAASLFLRSPSRGGGGGLRGRRVRSSGNLGGRQQAQTQQQQPDDENNNNDNNDKRLWENRQKRIWWKRQQRRRRSSDRDSKTWQQQLPLLEDVFGEEEEIKKIFQSLKSNVTLNEKAGTPYVFIIDKERNLRGRTDDEDEGTKYGFKATSVAELNNKMEDDVKIILAEYRLALKKNNAERRK